MNGRLSQIEGLKPAIEAAANRWGVKPVIHPQDYIFQFLLENPVFSEKQAAVNYYFDDGANSAEKLRNHVFETCGIEQAPFSMLEFASGYGCVSRHIHRELPMCELTTCDIHEEAIRFNAQVLGLRAKLSTSHPEDFPGHERYDTVFALSFFSHMPKGTFGRWLNRLAALVEQGGFLIFTTHGLATVRLIPGTSYDNEDYFFTPSSEQKDLNTEEYGTSVIKPSYVISKIFQIPDSELVFFKEAEWWGHQDLYILRKGSPRTGSGIFARQLSMAESRALLDRGEVESGVASLRQLSNVEPNNPEVWANLTLGYTMTGEPEQVIKAGARAVALNPDHFYVHFMMAQAYVQMQDNQSALTRYAQAVRTAPSSLDKARALIAVAATFLDMGDEPQACQALADAFALETHVEIPPALAALDCDSASNNK